MDPMWAGGMGVWGGGCWVVRVGFGGLLRPLFPWLWFTIAVRSAQHPSKQSDFKWLNVSNVASMHTDQTCFSSIQNATCVQTWRSNKFHTHIMRRPYLACLPCVPFLRSLSWSCHGILMIMRCRHMGCWASWAWMDGMWRRTWTSNADHNMHEVLHQTL